MIRKEAILRYLIPAPQSDKIFTIKPKYTILVPVAVKVGPHCENMLGNT